MRIALWLRRPPSRRQLVVMAVVVVIALLIGTLDWLGWWPDMLRIDKIPRQP